MRKIHKAGKMRGEKVKYPDGIGYTIWEPFKEKEEDDEDSSGICFDFPDANMPDIIQLLNDMKNAEPSIYEEDPKYTEFENKRKEKEKKWWYKVYDKINDIGIHFTPFDWRFSCHIITRPVDGKKMGTVSKWCEGIHFGPLLLTWWI
jgi:hypothetical protein